MILRFIFVLVVVLLPTWGMEAFPLRILSCRTRIFRIFTDKYSVAPFRSLFVSIRAIRARFQPDSVFSNLPSAICSFAVVSFLCCRRLFDSMPSACFSGTLHPVWSPSPLRGRAGERVFSFSLITIQSYDFFLRYASICRFFFKEKVIFFTITSMYLKSQISVFYATPKSWKQKF